MKHLRMLLALLLALGAIVTTWPVQARAGSGESVDEVAPPAGDSTALNSKGGVLAAVGCGLAVASFVFLPNPLSAGIASFDCTLMMLDAVDTPDR